MRKNNSFYYVLEVVILLLYKLQISQSVQISILFSKTNFIVFINSKFSGELLARCKYNFLGNRFNKVFNT